MRHMNYLFNYECEEKHMLNQHNKLKYNYYAVAGALTRDSIEQIVTLSNYVSLADCYYEAPLLYEPHITIARGLDEVDEAFLKQALSQTKVVLEVSGFDILEPIDKDYEIFALSIHSNELMELNKTILTNTSHTFEYNYQPHISLAFLKQGQAKAYPTGHLDLSGIKLSLSHYVLFDKEGTSQTII